MAKWCQTLLQWSALVMCIGGWQGVIVYFRVMDGTIGKGDTVRLMNTSKEYEIDEVGVLAPKAVEVRVRRAPACLII